MSSDKHQAIEDQGGKGAGPRPTAKEHPRRHNPLLGGQLGHRVLSVGPNPKAPQLIRCLCLTSSFPTGLAFCVRVHPKLLPWGRQICAVLRPEGAASRRALGWQSLPGMRQQDQHPTSPSANLLARRWLLLLPAFNTTDQQLEHSLRR